MKTIAITIIALLISITITAQTTFTKTQTFTVPSPEGDAPYAVKSADIDGDTYVDLVIGTFNGNSIVWFKNDGAGNFSQQTTITNTLTQVTDVELVDINGDNAIDVLATSFDGNKLVYFANNPSNLGDFGTEQVISSTVGGAGDIETRLLNGDAFLDVAVSAYNDGKVVWFANNGSGVFGTENIIDNTVVSPGSFDLQDIDNDGDIDAVISNATNQTNLPGQNTSVIEVFFNNALTFTKDPNSVIANKSYLFNVSFEDIDASNNTSLTTDILATDLFGDIYHYNKDITGNYLETIITTSIANPASVGFYDLDVDGLKDIVLTSGTNGAGNDLVWFKNNGAGSFAAETVIDAAQSNAFKFTIEDFDNDGDLDIASATFNGPIDIFINQKITLSVNDNIIEGLKIYPNPVSTKLFIKSNNTFNINVLIYDLLGKKLLESSVNNNTSINVSTLKKGLYFLKLENSTTTFKFIKK